MPIRPKFILGERRPAVARQFVGREELIAFFDAAMAKPVGAEPQVLTYYGVGGVGKTSLRRKLCELLDAKGDAPHAVTDFALPSHRDQETALSVLRKALRDRYRIPFNTFDVAYATYWQKSRPDVALKKNTFPFWEEGAIVADLVSLLGDAPVVGWIPKIAKMAGKGSKVLGDWWTKRGHAELRELPTLEAVQIAERLPMFWAADLRDFLRTKQTQAVLFLDTYEALTEGERSEGKLLQRDAWVRELAAQLPEVLWVVCGREKLRWEDVDKDWGKCISQHLLGGLSADDARRFLASCGVDDASVQDTVVTGSGGLPYYLDLAVDTFNEVQTRTGRPPTPDDFTGNQTEVFARFLRHLTQPEVETLKVLATPRFWTQPIFELLVSKFQTGYPLTAFNDLCRFSFISESSATGTWTMHALMRSSLIEHVPTELRQRVNTVLLEYHSAIFSRTEVSALSSRDEVAFAEAFYHAREVHAPSQLLEWLTQASDVFQRAFRPRLLEPMFRDMTALLERHLGPDHPDVATSLFELAKELYNLAKYTEAEFAFRRALKVRGSAFGVDSLEAATVATLLAGTLHSLGRYADCEELQRHVLAVQERALGEEHLQVADSLRMLGLAEYALAKYEGAETHVRRALAIREHLLGPSHSSTGRVTLDLGNIVQAQGRYAEAETITRRALSVLEGSLGENHPWVAFALNALGAELGTQKKPAEAEQVFRRALDILENSCGPEYPTTGVAMANLAATQNDLGRYAEAEELARRSLAVMESAHGPWHEYVALGLTNLGLYVMRQGRYVEAEGILRRALAIREKALAANHPEVAESLSPLAACLMAQSRYSEAETLLDRAMRIVEATLTAEHLTAVGVAENMAELHEKTGRTEQAKELRERVSKTREPAT